MKRLMLLVGVSLLSANVAQASYFFAEIAPTAPDASLPSDLGPISIEASRRAVQADITDWTDDKAQMKTPRVLSCALAGAETGILVGPAGSLATLGVLAGLDNYLSGQARVAGAPLNTPLADLANQVPFSATELQTLQRLMSREAPDLSDRIRLAIDTQSFLIKVSKRLYNEQINYHFKRTEGFWGFFRADPEYCAAFTLVAERDDQLIAASNRVLELYNSLESELKD